MIGEQLDLFEPQVRAEDRLYRCCSAAECQRAQSCAAGRPHRARGERGLSRGTYYCHDALGGHCSKLVWDERVIGGAA